MSDRKSNLPEISDGGLSALLQGSAGLMTPFSKEIYIGRQAIVGMRFQVGADALIKDLKPGDKITFLREPENEYDGRAVMAIDEKGRKLGYIPRRENLVMSALMDYGKVFFGVIPDESPEEYMSSYKYPNRMIESEIGIPVTITVDLYMREFAIPEDVTGIPRHGCDGYSIKKSTSSDSDDKGGELDKSIDTYPMSDRLRTVLRMNNILTLRELSRYSEFEAKRLKCTDQDCVREMQNILGDIGASLRPRGKRKQLYGYPEKIRLVARQKKDFWEHHLLFAGITVYYEWLMDARRQKAMFFWDDDGSMTASDLQQLKDLIIEKSDEIQSILKETNTLVNERMIEAVGAPGEPGDIGKIMKMIEDLAGSFKKIMVWRHEFKHINVPENYRDVIEAVADWGEDVLKEYDRLYLQCKDGVSQIEACLDGTMDAADISAGVKIKLGFDSGSVIRMLKNLSAIEMLRNMIVTVKDKDEPK